MICPSKREFNSGKGFTLVEVAAGIVILTMIAGSLLTALNGYIDKATNHDLKMKAFEVARENMEQLLGTQTVKDVTNFGFSQEYPEIEWETTIESFYEPTGSQMWVRAVCKSRYFDSEDKEQEIVLTHWLTNVSKQQMNKIQAHQRKLDEFERNYPVEQEMPDFNDFDLGDLFPGFN